MNTFADSFHSTSGAKSAHFSAKRRLGASLAKAALGAAVVAIGSIGLAAGEAHALVVTVDGTAWDVITFTGSYNDNVSKFNIPVNGGVMPWWGNNQLADDFANAVGAQLSFPNSLVIPNQLGPFFAYSADLTQVTASRFSLSAGLGESQRLVGGEFTWAQATPVPGPLPLLGAAAAFGASRQLRKRIKASKLPASPGDS